MTKSKEELRESQRLYRLKRRLEGKDKANPAVAKKAMDTYLKDKAGKGFKAKLFALVPDDILKIFAEKKPKNMTDTEFFINLVKNYG